MIVVNSDLRCCLSFYLHLNILDRFFNWLLQCPNITDSFLGDEMHRSPLELSRKRVELNVCESFKYFTQKLLRKYLKIFVILLIWFHHEGGLSESCHFELFFSTRYEAPPHKKSAFIEPPYLLFLAFALIFKFCFRNISCKKTGS